MGKSYIEIIENTKDELYIKLKGSLTLYTIPKYSNLLSEIEFRDVKNMTIDISELKSLDTAAAIFINNFQKKLNIKNKTINIVSKQGDVGDMLNLVLSQRVQDINKPTIKKKSHIYNLGKTTYTKITDLIAFISFFGELFAHKISYLFNPKKLRYKEIAFEINESAIRAIGIVSVTSFLIGLVVAYQGAYQLKTYGANIFIVDMMGVSVLRELSPIITAIVIAGRSASSYTAQIGAMKITQELDAMQTMGFDPHRFLVVPRIVALTVTLPILIFISDIIAIIAGMFVANINLGISTTLFIERFHDVVAVKHFFIGILKGPFFAFLIATIGIYRGMIVKDDTQSIGFNTTKSVVEAIFAVIICDAVFSIIFTNIGI